VFKDITRTTEEDFFKIEKLVTSMTTSTDNTIISSLRNVISFNSTYKTTSAELISTDMLSRMLGSAQKIDALQQFQP
jgi:hypothetical protein